MSLLGIDVGTSGCKAAVFAADGRLIVASYAGYGVQRSKPGWAELDAREVWDRITHCIREVVAQSGSDRVTALSVSSLGEAMVPVSRDRRILGPSVLNFDVRGEEQLDQLKDRLEARYLYELSGHILSNHFSLTKLRWIKDHEPNLYDQTFKFLPWGSFVGFMLGAEPVVDCSLAGRTLLFDVGRATWSEELLGLAKLDRGKLPEIARSGTLIGRVSEAVARELGLSPSVAVVVGAHDQCASAVGCGAIAEGDAMFAMGTYISITAVFTELRPPGLMVERGLNTEHHAVPGKYVTLMYNQGGAIVKWFRDTFASQEARGPTEEENNGYAGLLSEMPDEPSQVMVLPHFSSTGPPEFVSDSCGVLAGLRQDTRRGDVLKGILEGNTFYLRECVESLGPIGIDIASFRVVGGGGKSDACVRIAADIMGLPFVRPRVTEAGALGAAILAGVGTGHFASVSAGVEEMVHLDENLLSG